MKIKDKVNGLLRLFDMRLERASTFDFRYEKQRTKFRHLRPSGNPKLEFNLPHFEVTEEDLEITRRVVNAFQRTQEKEKDLTVRDIPSGDLWEKIRNESQAEFIELLHGRDIPKIAAVLVNALHHRISYGLCWDENRLTYEVACSPKEASNLATLIADRFISFAEALGVLYVEFPEWGPWGVNIYVNLENVYEKVEKLTRVPLAVPACFGLYGIRAGKYTINIMTPSHALAAWRIFEVLGDKRNSDICEIGGGYGGCAFYSFKRPLKSYTIIDLPLINLMQGFFLIKTCGPDNVQLYGEEDEEKALQVLPYWMMAEMPDKCFDITLNQESLTEIERKSAESYVAEIVRTTSRFFLSINQESAGKVGYKDFNHNLVPELIASNGGFRRRYRFPWWIRRGTVEELYEIVE